MTRQEAIDRGLIHYLDLNGCRNGHVPAKRYTRTRNCIQCAKTSSPLMPERVLVPPHQKAAFVAICNSWGWQMVNRPDTQHEQVTLQEQPDGSIKRIY